MSRRALVRLAVVLALLAVAGWLVLRATRPDPVAVAVRAVDRGTVEATVANTRAGTVKACRRAKLSPQVGGRVSRLPVRVGNRVAAGSLLLALWNDDLEAQARLATEEHAAAGAVAEQACLAAALAEREAERAARLFRDGVIGEQPFDRARSEGETTRATCAAARARIAEAEARIAVVREELGKTVLHAPFAGVIAELNAELGEVVTPSPPGIPTPPAVDLIEEGCLYVLAPIDEVDAPRVRPGQPARVSLDAFPGRVFDGTVRRVAPYVLDREKQARTVDVEVDLRDPSAIPGLAPGYSADVEVLLERRDGVLRVPTEALIEGRSVLVLADGKLERRAVETGVANWEFTEVRSGLAEGEPVVTSLDRAGVRAGASAVIGESPAS